jgi:dolichol-phosphate mannosyltransferase
VTTTVIVPTFNEKDNLPKLVEAILKADNSLQIIVVDDNSPDGTGDIADELAAQGKVLTVIHREKKLGLGTAYLAGFHEAVKSSIFVVTMDADFSHDPARIPALTAKAEEGFDLVIGSRYVKGGKVVDSKLWRRALSRGANFFATVILWFSTKDNTSGFRCYRSDTLERIIAKPFHSDGYSFLIEILYRAKKKGLRLGETPITFVNRQYGHTKISRAEIYKALWTVCRLRFSS